MIRRLAPACLSVALSVSMLGPLLTSGAAVAQQPVAVAEPRDVVASLYKLTIAALKVPDGSSPFFDRKARASYFSKSFDRLVTRSEAKAARGGYALIDFDPISASQDAAIGTVAVTTTRVEGGKAVVSAAFRNYETPTTVTYDLLLEDGAWKIDDIKGTSETFAWSARESVISNGK